MCDNIPIEIQWIVAIILPMWRELNVRVLSKLLEKATNYDLIVPVVPKLTATLDVNMSHAFYVAVLIANSSTPVTSYAILAADFVLNIHSSFHIIKLHKKVVSSDGMEAEKVTIERKEETLRLIAIETVEVLAPITYTITFLIGYHGPNATIIGGIRNTDFSNQEVEDVEHFVRELMKIIFVDFGCLIISGIMFWKVASINILQEGYKMMTFFWPLIAVKVGLFLVEVIINTNYI